jgi:phage pi2 protein 07
LGTTGGGTGTNLGVGGAGTGYLDPRVKMVVTSYPPTGIEHHYTQVPYPDRKIKKQQFTSGWWNVYIQIRTDETGRVTRRNILRPETNGPLEKIFVMQVNQEIDKWSFDPKEAEINIDVRFYVE